MTEEDGGGRNQPVHQPSSSAHVQLEVAILGSGEIDAESTSEAEIDGSCARTVMVVAAEPDMRMYLAECLKVRGGVAIVAAASMTAAREAARQWPPHLIVLDELGPDALRDLPPVPAIITVTEMMTNEPPPISPAGRPLAVLSHPFQPKTLLDEVDRLLG